MVDSYTWGASASESHVRSFEMTCCATAPRAAGQRLMDSNGRM